jgi:hypothetical protein
VTVNTHKTLKPVAQKKKFVGDSIDNECMSYQTFDYYIASWKFHYSVVSQMTTLNLWDE